jgi:hypothetical protein
LFQMLSGRLPFEGEPMEQLKSHLLAPVPSLSQMHPNGRARAELDALIQRAMAKQPAARFEDAAEMLAALEAIPQPWILAKDAEPTTSELGAASTLLDSRSTDAAHSGERPAPSVPQAPAIERASSSRARVLTGSALLVVSIAGAALYAIAREQRRADLAAPMATHARVAPKATAPGSAVGQPPVPPEREQPSAPASQVIAEAPIAAAASDTAPAETRAEPSPQTQAARVETRAYAVPRVPARDPWAHGTPKELRSIRKVVATGGFGSDRGIALLRKYSHANPDDARGYLLLARLYTNRHWRADAVNQYAAAYHADPSARGAAQMLSDLLGLVAQGAVADDAARLVQRAYGGEALRAIDRALASTRKSSAAFGRLRALRLRIAAG